MHKGDYSKVKVMNQHGPWGFFMLMAFIGALVYFENSAHNFGEVLFAILEAIAWPGILVFHVLQSLGA